MLIKPHGGELVNRVLSGQALEDAKAKAKTLPKITVDAYCAFDIDGIAKGLFSPATGFMNQEQIRRVLDTMHLRDGIPWTIPLMLAVSEADADRLEVGGDVAIEDDEGDVVAILHLSEKFRFDHGEIAEKVYLTRDAAHPGVAYTMGLGPVFLAGDLDVLKTRTIEFQEYNLTPSETRAAFQERGWSRIVAFQTRNPVHRAHEYLQKCALEMCDGLLLHPLMGTTKSDDIPGPVRMACYTTILDLYYPKDHVMLSLMPVNMRYAGPKEAIMHSIIRKNYGCSHFIVGRDHAGVGNYYGTYDAQKIFDQFDLSEIGITPLMFEHTFFCKACGNMGSTKTCPHSKEDHVFLSGTKVREMLKKGEIPPVEFTRPEVAKVLIKWAQSQGD
ncbi:MAG TPA: sulfate adenylyltransferase [Candidatus Hydrogenedentes bacterium]|nr:sulfate adenylyltransferase [Candidatus Hydrogenedentota bacterium]HPG69178.1 sulfate adenylyltransferase [Candidatus Hydrogenedentota bacterium]